MNFQRGREQDVPEINLIPLIDVLLVIIIFLMLTTTYAKFSGLEINLPTADAAKQAKIMAAEAEAASILKVQQAMADSMRLLNENAPNDQVIKLKALEALEKVADGKATKLIIPSEIQGLAGLAASAKMLVENDAPAAE